jgi:2-hydroxy-6-oxonona-2,4-dienedioate hydrolase
MMTTNPTITRIDQDDVRSVAAREAEENLFAYYNLDYSVHFVEMEEPDLRLRVLEVGSGPPLLIVPGGGGDAWPFAALMAELKGWRMIAINRPGSGLSDGVDNRQVDLRRLAADMVRTVADAFELDSVPIVCNSMGGLWSSWFTLEYPERVSRMVQMGCPALALDTSAPLFMRLLGVPGINNYIAPLMQPKSTDGALDFLSTQGSSKEHIDRMPQAAADAAYHFYQLPTYLDNWKTLIAAVASLAGGRSKYQLRADQLERIKQPTQIIWGENDVFGDLDVARQVERIIPNAKLHEMETGHLPFLDMPEETGRVVRDFLAQEQPEPKPELAAIA